MPFLSRDSGLETGTPDRSDRRLMPPLANYELLELPGKTTGKACFPGAGANGVPTTIWFPPVFM